MTDYLNGGARATGVTVLDIRAYMAICRSDNPRYPDESNDEYRQRLYILAQVLYKEDWESVQNKPAPTRDEREPRAVRTGADWDSFYMKKEQEQERKQVSVHDELKDPKQNKLRRAKERYAR